MPYSAKTPRQRRISIEESYQLQMLQYAEQIVRTLIRHNLHSQHRILELFDQMVEFPSHSTTGRASSAHHIFDNKQA